MFLLSAFAIYNNFNKNNRFRKETQAHAVINYKIEKDLFFKSYK